MKTRLPLVVTLAVLAARPAFAGGSLHARAQVVDTESPLDAKDEARQVAEDYLRAIAHEGNEAAVESLLGGATLTARMYGIDNWKIVGREKHRQETGELADLRAHVAAIDKAGKAAANAVLRGGGSAGGDPDGMAMMELSADDSARLMAPTKAKADAFSKSHPAFAYMARVDKQVYWHPKNPFRKLLADAGAKGRYTLDFDLFWIETVEGAHEDKRVSKWPLRVVRFRANGVDSGIKILPAAHWNAE